MKPTRSRFEGVLARTSTYAVWGGFRLPWCRPPKALRSKQPSKAARRGCWQGRPGLVKILGNKDIDIAGFPGKEVVVENSDKKYTLTVRLYLVRRSAPTPCLRQPLWVSPPRLEPRQFLDSFHLVR